MKKILFIYFLLQISLAGCSVVKSTVTVFHKIETPPTPKTYIFIPFNDQANSLEYKSYADEVGRQLLKYKYMNATHNDKPEIAIAISYGVDSGKNMTTQIPVWGQTGLTSSATTGTFSKNGNFINYSGNTTYQPTYGLVGSMPISQTIFTHFLNLWMVEAKTIGTENPAIIFEATVTSQGRAPELPVVLPYMISSLFRNFPGMSGRTESVEEEVKTKPTRF